MQATAPAAQLTITSLLARHAAETPHRAAVTEAGRIWSWTELQDRVAGLAADMARHGISQGDRVALWLPNGIDYVSAILATARLGALAAHVNTRFGPHEVGDVIARTRAKLLMMATAFPQVDFPGVLDAIAPEKLATVEAILCSGAYNGADPRFTATDLAGQGPDFATPAAAGLIFTTGGTTAKPKLVVHSQASIAGHALAVMRHIGTDQPGAALLGAVPFCGTFGNVALMSAIAGGAHIVAMPIFDGPEADALIRQHGITHLVGDDRMLARLADAATAQGRFEGFMFSGVAGFHSGAASAFARAAKLGLRPHSIYGSSEVQALFAIGDPANEGFGPVMPVHPASSVTVSQGDNPELLIAGPSLFDFYLDDPQATASAKTAQGFRTGDRAQIRGQAFLFEGRMGDVLRLGGFLVNPLEIESFLEGQPGIAAAQVVGVEVEHGTAAVAFVIACEGGAVDEASLRAACKSALARHKIPACIVALVDFPISNGPNGPKIARAELRRMAQDLTETASRRLRA